MSTSKRGNAAKQLLEGDHGLHAGGRGAEAVVVPVAEREDVLRLAGDVELVGVRAVRLARRGWRRRRAAAPCVPSGMVVPSTSTSRVVVRARPCTGEVSRSSSSTASGMRLGSSTSSSPLVGSAGQQLHGAAEHPGRRVVAAGDHREGEAEDRQQAVHVVGHAAPRPGARWCRRSGSLLAALGELGEVRHQLAGRLAPPRADARPSWPRRWRRSSRRSGRGPRSGTPR